jgi:hypothetical protein
MSKLMGIPFGINLNISDMKKVGRFKKTFKYLSMMRLPLASRVVVINTILASSLWLFANVRLDPKRLSRNVKPYFVITYALERNKILEQE